MSALVWWLAIKHHIICNLNRVPTRVWIEHFAIILVYTAIVWFCSFCIKNLRLLRSWRLRHMLKLLLWLSIKILWSVTCTFWLSHFLPFKCLVLSTELLIPRRHSLFQQLQTALRFLMILRTIISCHHLVARYFILTSKPLVSGLTWVGLLVSRIWLIQIWSLLGVLFLLWPFILYCIQTLRVVIS